MTLSPPAIGLARQPYLRETRKAESPSTDPRGTAIDGTTVADVMSAPPVGVDPVSSLFDAAVRMRSSDLSELPVVDPVGRLLGVLRARDLVRGVEVPPDLPEVRGLLDVLMIGLYDQPVTFFAQLRTLLEETSVQEAMSPRPTTVPPDASIASAMEALRRFKTDRALVVDQGRLVGVVTGSDLLLGALRRSPPPPPEPVGHGTTPRGGPEGGPR